MKFAHKLMAVLLVLLVVACAAAGVYASLSPDVWNRVMTRVAAERIHVLWASIGTLVFVILFWMTAGRPKKDGDEYLTFDTDAGSISISIKAIHDFLKKLTDEFAAVLSLEPALRSSGGGLDVLLDIRVRSGVEIPELCRMLQDRVKESLSVNLGVSEVKAVRITVREIMPAPKPESKENP